MGTVTPFRRREPPDLQVHAMDDLRYIRATMERASSVTAVPGWGQVVIGGTAIVASLIAARWTSPDMWIATWAVEAMVAMVLGLTAMAHKAARTNVPFMNSAGRRFALSFSLPILVGAVLTVLLYHERLFSAIPGMWLLLYGTAVATGGAFSVKIVPRMGYCFMVAGVVALICPESWADAVMAASFGGLHVVFGLIVARRYGG